MEFPVGQHGITLELAEQVEKQLSAEGRHTYLYAPEADEPVEIVLHHLTEAGVVVLLVLDEAFAGKTFAQDDKTYYRNWQPDGTLTVSEAAEFVKKYLPMRRAYPYTEILSNAARGTKPFTRRSLLIGGQNCGSA